MAGLRQWLRLTRPRGGGSGWTASSAGRVRDQLPQAALSVFLGPREDWVLLPRANRSLPPAGRPGRRGRPEGRDAEDPPPEVAGSRRGAGGAGGIGVPEVAICRTT
jgi:hypothetical protein